LSDKELIYLVSKAGIVLLYKANRLDSYTVLGKSKARIKLFIPITIFT